MKSLLTIFTFISTVMFSSTSYAEWTKVNENSLGNTYIDFERIRSHDGYIYYWILIDLFAPNEETLSMKSYKQGDCKLFRFKYLSISTFKEPMGNGTSKTVTINDNHWQDPPPDTTWEDALNRVCSQ